MSKLTVENAPKWEPEVELVSITPNPEAVIEQTYRNCWQTEPKEPGLGARRRFLEKRITQGHLQPLEFAFATFVVVGSRTYTHQQVRHRIATFAQESQRYVRPEDSCYVVVPPKIHADPAALEIFVGAIK